MTRQEAKLAKLTKLANATLTEIGCQIRIARKKKGLSQTQLADLVNVSRQTISGIETDTFNVTFLILFKVVAVLELDITQFLVLSLN
jgi:transcriptional regulator with XRE-family HTH domain